MRILILAAIIAATVAKGAEGDKRALLRGSPEERQLGDYPSYDDEDLKYSKDHSDYKSRKSYHHDYTKDNSYSYKGSHDKHKKPHYYSKESSGKHEYESAGSYTKETSKDSSYSHEYSKGKKSSKSSYYSSKDYSKPSKSDYGSYSYSKETSKGYGYSKEPSKGYSYSKEPSKGYEYSKDYSKDYSYSKEPSKSYSYSKETSKHSSKDYSHYSSSYSHGYNPKYHYRYKKIKSTSKARFNPLYKRGCLVILGKPKEDKHLMLGYCRGAGGWRRDKYGLMHSELHDGMCIQVDRGGAHAEVGSPLRLYKCDKGNDLQKWDYRGKGVIRLKGTHLCAAFHGPVADINKDPIILKPCLDDTTRWADFEYDYWRT